MRTRRLKRPPRPCFWRFLRTRGGDSRDKPENDEGECRKVRKLFFNQMRKLLKMRRVRYQKPRSKMFKKT